MSATKDKHARIVMAPLTKRSEFDKLYVRLVIERRLAEVEAGNVITHAEARRRLRSWLKD